jgi:hypothetical protein
VDVDAIRHDVNPLRLDSGTLENGRNGAGDRDDRVGASVLPSRAEVVAQWKVHAPRDNQRNVSAEGRERGHGNRMRRVSVDQRDSMLANRSPKPEWRDDIELGSRTAVDDLQSRRARALVERFIAACRDDRPVAAVRKLPREPQRLPLAAAPAALRIDVQHSNVHGAQLRSTTIGAQVQPRTAASQ